MRVGGDHPKRLRGEDRAHPRHLGHRGTAADPQKLEIGEPLKLSLYFSNLKAQDAVVVMAKVVRSEARPRAVADVWSFSAAVQFDESLAQHAKIIAEVAARQKEIFGDS